MAINGTINGKMAVAFSVVVIALVGLLAGPGRGGKLWISVLRLTQTDLGFLCATQPIA